MSVLPPSFTCPRCSLVSYHAKDATERYCVRCHLFFTPQRRPELEAEAQSPPPGPADA